MKVSGGLVGITLDPGARRKCFLIAPELARRASESEEVCTKMNTRVIMQSRLLMKRGEANVTALKDTILHFTNPFTDDHKSLQLAQHGSNIREINK